MVLRGNILEVILGLVFVIEPSLKSLQMTKCNLSFEKNWKKE